MGLLDKIFSKKNEVRIDSEGNISTECSIKVNGQEVNIPVSTNIEKMRQFEVNRANPISCERKPTEEEVKLPIEGFFEKYKVGLISEVGDRVWGDCMKARNKGYSYFVVNQKDYDVIIKQMKSI